MQSRLHPAQRDMTAAARHHSARRLLVAALAAASSIFLVVSGASAATHAQRKPKPDLVVTVISVNGLPGSPPYIVVDEQTRALDFGVKVVTKNIGTATAGKSVTRLRLIKDGKTVWEKTETVGRLTPGMYRTSTFVIDDLKVDPGLLHVEATADEAKQISESNETNNTLTRRSPIPVIPREWKVIDFKTTVNPGGGVSTATLAGSGFYYLFSRFDEKSKWFVYKAYGRVNAQQDFVGGGCAGHGKTHDTQSPWPGSDSELIIRANLSAYSAGVDTTKEPPGHYTVTCQGGVTFPETFPWLSLVTWVGTHSFPSMKPDDITLEGQGKATTPAGPAKYTWVFNARVSGV